MARVFLFAFVIGVTLYALLDWVMNSKKDTPGGLSRWLWLAVIVILPVVGPLAWIVLRLVGKAEQKQNPTQNHRQAPRRGAPDDDAEFLDDWSKKIERRQKRSRPPNPKTNPDPDEPGGNGSGGTTPR